MGADKLVGHFTAGLSHGDVTQLKITSDLEIKKITLYALHSTTRTRASPVRVIKRLSV